MRELPMVPLQKERQTTPKRSTSHAFRMIAHPLEKKKDAATNQNRVCCSFI